MAPGACAFAPLVPSSPPRSSGTRFQPPGLREEEGAGQARPGHLGVTRRLQLPLPRPQGLGRGPPTPTQLENHAMPAQEAGRDLLPPANSPLSYPLESGGLGMFPNAC